MNMIGNIYGLKLIVAPPIEVVTSRSWKERLFTRPWRPLAAHNTSLKETIPDGEVFKTPDSLIMNQRTYSLLKAQLDAEAREINTKTYMQGGHSGWLN